LLAWIREAGQIFRVAPVEIGKEVVSQGSNQQNRAEPPDPRDFKIQRSGQLPLNIILVVLLKRSVF